MFSNDLNRDAEGHKYDGSKAKIRLQVPDSPAIAILRGAPLVKIMPNLCKTDILAGQCSEFNIVIYAVVKMTIFFL